MLEKANSFDVEFYLMLEKETSFDVKIVFHMLEKENSFDVDSHRMLGGGELIDVPYAQEGKLLQC